MAWKSTTFKTSAPSGRFVVKGGKASGRDMSTSGKTVDLATGGKVPAVVKEKNWSVVKDGPSAAPKPLGETKRATAQTVAKYRGAMSGVIQEAKKIAEDRRETLDSIKDPELKRSAAR